MTRIPSAVSLLSTGKPRDLQKLLIAAILHTEEDILVITESELSSADGYTLVTTMIEEEHAVVLSVRPR